MPVNSSFQASIDFDIFSQIILDMSDFHDLYSMPMYFICGDMNSRTGTLTNYIEMIPHAIYRYQVIT